MGYAKGNNYGLSKVKSKYALILNPDTELDKNSIDNFFNTATEIHDFAIIAPAVQEKKDLKSLNDSKDIQEVETVKGFAMFLNLSKFKDIGFFDDNFFIYFEEIDLCKRLKKNEQKIYLDPKIKIFHKGGSSHNLSINFEMELSRNWHWMWSSFYFHKKYSGFLFGFFKVGGKFISALIKTVIYTVTFNDKKKKIYSHRLSGLYNSIIGEKSWYRPKIF